MLRDELRKLLPNSKQADFALGYFFVSGYREIHESLAAIPKIRILMSATTNLETVEAILAGYKSIELARREVDRRRILSPDAKALQADAARREVKESLEVLEPEPASELTVRGLIDAVEKGQLDVRVYLRGTLHAKCYLLHWTQPIREPGAAIVGSSNLSISGLSHNSELNLHTGHPADFEKLCEWFEKRWEEGEPFKEDFLNILRGSWAGDHPYTPKDVYYKALYERVRDRFETDESLEQMLPSDFPQLFEYQLLALKQAVQKVRRFNGVIIGDVVGLGKTYIGAALMRTLEQEGFRPMVICPPHLEEMWRDFCGRFEVNARVLSQGMLRKPDEDVLAELEYRDRDLVLIDESHNFRHGETLQYERLYRYMQRQGRAAILVTATPLSNWSSDVYNQVRLFHEGDATNIPIPAHNLKTFFREVEDRKASLGDLLTHVMIRRTRRFVLEHYGVDDGHGRKYLPLNGETWYFPERELQTVTYDVDKTFDGHYEAIMKLLSKQHLTLSRYNLFNYLKKGAKDQERYAGLQRVGPQLLGLMRKILLKRMESSIEAFRRTIETLTEVYRLFLEAARKGLIPAGEDQQKQLYDVAREGGATGADLDALLDELASTATQYYVGDFDIEKLKADLAKDLETFERIGKILSGLRPTHDDKLERLMSLVAKIAPKEKILIFTEYADTAKYLDAHLKTRREKAVVHGDVKAGRGIERVVRRFAPTYNPGPPLDGPEINLLMSTDILSEGMNLQDARVVVNYDLHWNPTRLIQRIGRVDRLSREATTVQVFNFLPGREIEQHLNLEQRLRQRIDEIHRIIGEDNKILHPDEQLNTAAMYAIYQKLKLDDGPGDGFLGLDQVEQELRRLAKDDPDYWKTLQEMPAGIRAAAPPAKGNRWGALVTCGLGIVQEHYIVRPGGNVERAEWESAFRVVALDKESAPLGPPAEASAMAKAALDVFRKGQGEIGARRDRVETLPSEQRWATELIARARKALDDRGRGARRRIDDLGGEARKRDQGELDELFKAYMRPIVLPAAKKELRRLKRSESDASGGADRMLDRLRQIYQTYELGRRAAGTPVLPVTEVARVLYVRMLPLDALERVLKEAS
jgi:superfamily II DNA or RNA helicase